MSLRETAHTVTEDYLDLWLIRHGESTHNKLERIQGQLDTDLTELGVKQAELLGKRLAGLHFDSVYSSDLKRALHTAQLASPRQDIIQDTRLREISFGVLEDKHQSELSEEEQAIFDYVKADRYNRGAPEGESWQDHETRMKSWFNDLPATGRVLAFTHGGSVRVTVFAVTGHHPKRYEWNVHFGNTCINRFRFAPSSKLILGLNDTAHLEPLERT